jgi:hypothetical protein
VFLLSGGAITFARLKLEEPVAVLAVRRWDYPPGEVSPGPHGAPVFSPRAFAEAAAGAAQLCGGKLSRASAVFPDSWSRTITLDFESLPSTRKDRADMVAWKLKKLLPGRVDDLEISFAEIPGTSGAVRLLVSAFPRETLRSIEAAFAARGIRIGLLAPATLALFAGADERLAKAAGGDYLLLHRAPGATSLLIARGGQPLFYRQKSQLGEAEPEEAAEEVSPAQRLGQELRLSLSYYSENLGGGKSLSALYLWDEEGDSKPLASAAPLATEAISAHLLSVDPSFQSAAAVYPEIWPSLAATRESA